MLRYIKSIRQKDDCSECRRNALTIPTREHRPLRAIHGHHVVTILHSTLALQRQAARSHSKHEARADAKERHHAASQKDGG